jgi:SAM-dependent methyltransferase
MIIAKNIQANIQGEETRKLRNEIFLKSNHLNWLNQFFVPTAIKLVKASSNCSGQRVLDIGCGNGEIIKQILQSLPNSTAVGIDAMDDHVEGAKINLSEFADRSVIYTGSFEDIDNWSNYGQFDLIFSFNLLHFINGSDLIPCMMGVAKLLNNTGLYITKQITKSPHEFAEEYLRVTSEYCQELEPQDEVIKTLKKSYQKLLDSGERLGFSARNVFHADQDIQKALFASGFKEVDMACKLLNHSMFIARKR